MAGAVQDGAPHDVQSLLSSPDRDFLIRNNGDQVKVDNLKGKKIGLYFSASWCGPCHRFTPILVEVYNELSPEADLEIIFISADKDEESFRGYFSKMPWLAIPFSDSDKRDSLNELFKVRGIPHLVILDGTGTVLTDSGDEIIRKYGVEGYPFTPERIKELKDQEEAARRNQSLTSLLVHGTRDFVVSSDGNQVPITELEGKTVGLYFLLSKNRACGDFTPKLMEVYEKLKAKGESFEVVLIPLDDDEASFNQTFESMPWLSLPLKDKKCEKLVTYFELSTLPTLVIIGPNGKTLHSNVSETVEEHGIAAYPFTPEKFAELAEIEKQREESQTLESILVSGDLDFVIGKEGTKIPVSDLRSGSPPLEDSQAPSPSANDTQNTGREREATRMADVVGVGAASHDVQSLLSSPDRDFLIRNNGDQVKVDSLKGKKIGLYFSASCGSGFHHWKGWNQDSGLGLGGEDCASLLLGTLVPSLP
ncbi:hypothetical protein NL676_022533 [Syzygium grande]|nr:hypothetical protein NL676_022533 [Syzygium grande]